MSDEHLRPEFQVEIAKDPAFSHVFDIKYPLLSAPAHVSCELKDDVAVIRLNDPTAEANALSAQMQSELTATMGEIWSNGTVKSVVFISIKPGCSSDINTESPPNATKTVLGTPESMLGRLPGAGSTQRLSKMVGLPGAFDKMLTGRNIRADKAKKMGVAHQLVDPLGPGLKPAEQRTTECLEDVAVGVAEGIANEKVPLTAQESLMQSQRRLV